MSDRIKIMEDTKWNYLLFCSGNFELDMKKKGDCYFTASPRSGKPYKVDYHQWDHYAMIICDSYAAKRLMEMRDDYYFPSQEEMNHQLERCEAYPDNMLNWIHEEDL